MFSALNIAEFFIQNVIFLSKAILAIRSLHILSSDGKTAYLFGFLFFNTYLKSFFLAFI